MGPLVPILPACSRCGRQDGLVTDDGPIVCHTCLLAWGDYARLLHPPAAAPAEPGSADFAHARHAVPYLGCYLCVQASSARRSPGPH